jgi:hypothetical protein
MRHLRAKFCLLPLLLLTLLSIPAAAQEELAPGEVEFQVSLGYSSYALPVANSATGRGWAAAGNMAWQAAYNHSVVPVRVDILHRQPMALSGYVEVESPYAAPREADPQGHPCVVRRGFIAPPSAPVSLMLRPRVCPPAEPGANVELSVRIYREGNPVPVFAERLSATQLEPAHLYGLLLDGPRGSFYHDQVNPDNHLGLSPQGEQEQRPAIAASLLETDLYTLACDRRQVTLSPLAARDFAFVFAALPEVRQWPEAEQQALVAYALAGGFLCLYGAEGSWQGLDSSPGAHPVGRGYLLAVAGGLEIAREEAVRWLEGELEEFVTLMGGNTASWVPHYVLDDILFDPQLRNRLSSQLTLNAEEAQAELVLAHQPGFLHPVWIRRELARTGALEPWDWPEFSMVDGDPSTTNQLVNIAEELGGTQVKPLSHLATAPRQWFPAYTVVLGVLIALAASGLLRRPTWAAWGMRLVLLAVGGVVFAGVIPLPQPVATARVIETEPGMAVAVSRTVQATAVDRMGIASVELEPEALVRRVAWQQAGRWATGQAGNEKPQQWRSMGGGPFAVVVSEAVVDAPEFPVKLKRNERIDGSWQLVFDTTGIGDHEYCYLMTDLGWQTLEGGRETVNIEWRMPDVGVLPGSVRLMDWEDWLRTALPASARGYILPEQRMAGLLGELNQPRMSGSPANPLWRLGMLALVQNPIGMRGMLNNQLVLLYPTNETGKENSSADKTITIYKATMPLEERP